MESVSPEKLYFECRSCERKLGVPVELAGVVGPCPGCGATIRAPHTLESISTRKKADGDDEESGGSESSRSQNGVRRRRSGDASSRLADPHARYEREELKTALRIGAATCAVVFICLVVKWYLESGP